jgi:excisionase family DNA binding protein
MNTAEVYNPFSAIERRLSFLEAQLSIQQPQKAARPDILDIEALRSEFLPGTPEGTIYQWTHKRLIPSFRVGRRLYFRRAEIEQWMLNKRRPTINERAEKAVSK